MSDLGWADGPRGRSGLARPVRRCVEVLRPGRHRRAVQRGRRVPLPPVRRPLVGRAIVVASWLGESASADQSTRDAPGTYEARYSPVAIDGETVVATGTSWYREVPEGPVVRVYENCFVIRFDGQDAVVSSRSTSCATHERQGHRAIEQRQAHHATLVGWHALELRRAGAVVLFGVVVALAQLPFVTWTVALVGGGTPRAPLSWAASHPVGLSGGHDPQVHRDGSVPWRHMTRALQGALRPTRIPDHGALRSWDGGQRCWSRWTRP